MEEFFQLLKQLDVDLFLFLNGKHHAFFDVLMVWISYKFTWIPFYGLLLLFIVKKYGWRSLLLIAPLTALLITISDQSSVHLFKNVFERYRPCHNLEIGHLIHTVGKCGGKFGFVSSHATNSFALAVFIGMILKTRNWMGFMLFWAFVVSYSRIYLGVHYPLDIIGGALVGILIGWGVGKVYFQIWRKTGFL